MFVMNDLSRTQIIYSIISKFIVINSLILFSIIPTNTQLIYEGFG